MKSLNHWTTSGAEGACNASASASAIVVVVAEQRFELAVIQLNAGLLPRRRGSSDL